MSHLLPSTRPRGWRKAILPILAAIWLTALIPGVRYLLAYEGTAGVQGAAPPSWPRSVPPIGDSHLPTLVVALHPRCSCSAATLTELEEAAGETDRRFNTVLYIYQPSEVRQGVGQPEWHDGRLYEEAQSALHATIVGDENGRYAAAFGARTSGEVLYYSAAKPDRGRQLLFAGGVTAGRGMTGDNRGLENLKNVWAGEARVRQVSSPVFGCGLFGEHFIEKGAAQ